MEKLKKSMTWIGPIIIVIAGIMLLFNENYQEVAEPPSEGWSRDLKIGTTPNASEPSLSTMKNGGYSVAYITDNGTKRNTYNKSLELLNEESYEIPVDKFTKIYLNDDTFIFSDYYNMFNGHTGEKIAEIQDFFPLKDKVLYREDNRIYLLNTASFKGEEVVRLKGENTQVLLQQQGEEIQILTNDIDQAGNHLTFYNVVDGKTTKLGASTFRLNDGEEVEGIQFGLQNNSYALIVQTYQKQSMSGKVENTYYYAQSDMNSDLRLNQVEFQDPITGRPLNEISDIELNYSENATELLFKAFGSTKTTFRKSSQFNIYEAMIDSESVPTVKRLSNTPNPSLEPEWLTEDIILWIDRASDGKNNILVSSSRPALIEKADTLTMTVFLQALGKTMGMLSTGLFAIVVSVIWFIWPLIFLCIVMFTNSKAMDNDKPWIFYAGAFIYLAAAAIFNDSMFSSGGMTSAPDYLIFPGSSFVYLIGFALLSFAILQAGTSIRKWSPAIELTYFIGIHITCVTIFFGPYLL